MQALLVGHGGAKANRRLAEEHKLESPILVLGSDRKTPAFSKLWGRPSRNCWMTRDGWSVRGHGGRSDPGPGREAAGEEKVRPGRERLPAKSR